MSVGGVGAGFRVLGSTMVGFGGAGVHRGIALLGTLGAGSWGALGLDLEVLGALGSTVVGLGGAGSRIGVLGTLEAGIWVLGIETGVAGSPWGH